MNQQQTFAHRRAHAVNEFGWRRTGATLFAVDDNEVRRDAGHLHCLGDREPFPGMADRQLKAGRFAADRCASGR